MRRPNLFVIGAQKCGTTSLHDYLAHHPSIFMSEPKEPGFFVPEMLYYPKDQDWYLGLFRGAGDTRWIGESSTHYTKLPIYPGVPRRIRSWVGEARFIYLMRDPVERAISHYWHNVHRLHESRPIDKALREGEEYRAFGDYAMQLRPWFEAFQPDLILPLVFEEMVENPEHVLGDVFSWLDLHDPIADHGLARKNVRPEKIQRTKGRGWLNSVRSWPAWDALSPAVPRLLKEWAKGLALEEVDPAHMPDQETTAFLQSWAMERVRDLEGLLGRSFPEWGPRTGR